MNRAPTPQRDVYSGYKLGLQTTLPPRPGQSTSWLLYVSLDVTTVSRLQPSGLLYAGTLPFWCFHQAGSVAVRHYSIQS